MSLVIVWNKENIRVPDGNPAHDLPNTGLGKLMEIKGHLLTS